MSVIYLFTRYKFNWSEVEFSFFSTYAMLTSLVGEFNKTRMLQFFNIFLLGTLFSVGVFSHLLKIDDAIIGVLSSMSKIISSFVYAFAANTWQLYLGPIAEILNGTSFIAMRSIASKLVQSDELVRFNEFQLEFSFIFDFSGKSQFIVWCGRSFNAPSLRSNVHASL